jgi:putative MATE family efflux protein
MIAGQRESSATTDAGLDSPFDPEGAPDLPATTLAAGAAPVSLHVPRQLDSLGELWALSWPVMLSQTLLNAVGLLDIAMVGRIGSEAVAAAGYATQFFHLAQSVLFAVGSACVALMAHALGARDVVRARRALAASLLVSVGSASALTLLMLAAPAALLRGLGAEPRVVELCVPYLAFVVGSTPLLAVSMMLEFAMRADRNARTPMFIAGAVTSTKIGLNLLWIFGLFGFPQLGLTGAGLATWVSQLLGLALFLGVIWRAGPGSALAVRRPDFRHARGFVREVVRLALPGVGERFANNLALLAYFRVLSGYGSLAIAAYTVGVRLLAFTWIPGTGFGTAASTLVGQALGAANPAAASRAGWRATWLSLGVAAVLGAGCLFAPGEIAGLFTEDPALVGELAPFLVALALAQPALQTHFALGGALRGAGDTWTPFVAAAVGNWALRVPLAFLFAYALRAPVVWIWGVIVADHLARALWLGASFRRGAWRGGLADPAPG